MTRQTTVDNYLALLEALSKRKHRISSVSKQLVKFRVSRGASKHLKKMNLLKELPHGGYKWSGNKPTEDIARDLVTRINAEVTEAMRKTKDPIANAIGRDIAMSRRPIVGMPFHTIPMTVLSKLRKERDEHVTRIAKIDAVLTAAKELA